MSAEGLGRDLMKVADALEDTTVPDREAVVLVANQAKLDAPFRSGYLVSTITPLDTQVAVYAPYGRVIHDGWQRRGIRANPFLERAPDRVDWPAPYVEHIDNALEKLSNTY